MSRRIARRALIAITIAAVGACGPRSELASSPFASPDPCVESVCLTFHGHSYVAFNAQSEPTVATGSGSLTIPLMSLHKTGTATAVNADIGRSDFTVFSIDGVDEDSAVAMFIGDASVPWIQVWTRDGVSPSLIAGLCDYFIDPSRRQCHSASSPASTVP